MFLKEIEISGFKSFKDRTVIRFDHEITGVVGPNGCGKSNIADAVRWALGEQSQKSLRSGKERSDIVFAGNADYKPSMIASVILRFDNSDGIFPLEFNEIEIARKYYKSSNETVYYLNQKPCQLQEISSLILDTGLGKDSLSIITQGNILSFAEAAPLQRRALFEEAAGVARYRRRKKVSLTRLDQTQNNLERVSDLINELESQIPRLNDQIRDAKEYNEAVEKLEYINIFLLVESFISNRKKANATLNQQELAREELKTLEDQIKDLENEQSALQKEFLEQNDELTILQKNLEQQREKQFELEKKEAILTERAQSSPAAFLKDQISSLQQTAGELESQIQPLKEKLTQNKGRFQSITQVLKERETQRDSLISQKRDLESRISQLRNRMKNPAHFERLKSIPGIFGAVNELVDPLDGFETAISVALGSAGNQVVAKTQEEAKAAISFLKKNHLPRTTFIPLDLQKQKTLNPVVSKFLGEPGVLGSAYQFVKYSPKFQDMVHRLLAETLIVDNMETALKLAKQSGQKLKIVTLEGELLARGGNISGGLDQKMQNQRELLQKEKNLAGVIKSLNPLLAWITKNAPYKNELAALIQQLEGELNQNNVQRKYLLDNINDLKKKLSEIDEEGQEDLLKLQEDLQKETEKTKACSVKLQQARDHHAQVSRQIESDTRTIRQKQRELLNLQNDLQKAIRDHTRFDSLKEVDLRDLYEQYHITLENALLKVQDAPYSSRKQAVEEKKRLEEILNSLGEINHAAFKQFQELNERYTFLKSQHDELENARQQILDAMDEMDETMEKTFLETFENINTHFEKVFQAMFGGGHARLFLTDPKAPLECGIDLEVSPPGKKMKGLQSYSGGEKSLIAISVLFSILQARRIPLCIFDEVEAALDAANVERFSRYVRRFRDQSQFIIITHRQGTMEKCDALYGVTMQKDGISRMLHVSLEDSYGLSRQNQGKIQQERQ